MEVARANRQRQKVVDDLWYLENKCIHARVHGTRLARIKQAQIWTAFTTHIRAAAPRELAQQYEHGVRTGIVATALAWGRALGRGWKRQTLCGARMVSLLHGGMGVLDRRHAGCITNWVSQA